MTWYAVGALWLRCCQPRIEGWPLVVSSVPERATGADFGMATLEKGCKTLGSVGVPGQPGHIVTTPQNTHGI